MTDVAAYPAWWPSDEDFRTAAFVSIPLVASLIGWGTNIVAIQMTFLPLEYVGFFEGVYRNIGFSLGWQGIIPAAAEKIARKMVTIITTRLVSVDDVFGRLDPAEIASLTRPALTKALDRVIERVAVDHAHDVWEALPLFARHELVEKASEQAEPYIAAMVGDLRAELSDILDLHQLSVDKLLEDKSLMNEIFQRCGDAEFRFIERSGLYFGFLLGVLQALLWWALLELQATLPDPSLLPLWWFLPLAGALCGYVTNNLALGLIFNPVEPIGCLGCVIHGLFLQRQIEVSEEFALISSARVITAANCWENILYGKGRHRFKSIVTRHTTRAIDDQVGVLRPLVPFLVGSDNFHAAKLQAADLIFDELPHCLRATYRYTEETMDMQRTLSAAMKALPSSEFERVLHPAFEEDEWKLIGVGGLLGLFVGSFQQLFVFKSA